MGLLSALSFGQQSPWLPPWINPYAPAQPQQPTPMDWSQFPGYTPAPQQRQRGPAPLQANTQNVAPLAMGGGPELAPMPGAANAQVRPPNFSERIEGLYDSPLLNIGLSLLGNAQNGGDWSAVGRDLSTFSRERRQRQLQEEALRRQRVSQGREDTEWEARQRRQARAQEYINGLSPEERARYAMIAPDDLPEYLQGERQYGLQERGLDLQIEEMRNNNRFRGASLAMDQRRLEQDRMLNSAVSVLGREEAQRLGGDISRLRGWSMIDNDMGALEEILERNPEAFNNLLDADVEQALARIRDPQTRRDVQTIYSIGTGMAREELRGQTPVSNIDLLSAIRAGPSPSSGSAFARDWLNRAYQDRSDLETYVQGAINYMQQPDGSRRTLFEPDPATGRNFYQSDAFRRYTQDGRQNFNDVAGGRGGGARQTDEQREVAEVLQRRRAAGPGTVGGRSGAPRMLREPVTILERQAVSEYNTALQRGQTERARGLERRLRNAGLIP